MLLVQQQPIIVMFGDRFLDLQIVSDKDYIYEDSKEDSFFSADIHTNPHQPHYKETVTIPIGLALQQYPVDFSNANPFCPICGKFVAQSQSFLVYQSVPKRKKYLLHGQCAEQKQGKNLAMSQSPETKLQSIVFLTQQRSLPIGGQEFYFEFEIFHPLGSLSLAKMWTKLKSIGNTVTWDIKNNTQTDCFSPNIVAFPFPDFQIVVNMMEIGEKQSSHIRKAVISVGRLRSNEVQLVKAYTSDLEITMKIIGNKEQKIRTVQEMNLKYRYPLDTGTSMVELLRIQVKLPTEDSDDDEYDDESRRRSSLYDINSQKYSVRDGKSQALSERSIDKEKVDLEKLINNQKLGQFVRQNTQSRVFQGWLEEATPREVDQVISALWEELPELITHEYANYMIQKMIGVCTFAQRVKISTRLQADIPGIARNKQGTHSLQTLIKLFTTDQEYQIVCNAIKHSFLTLAQHPNATHFLQKVISLFPINHIYPFMDAVTEDFLSFAQDKHGMCVIKVMIMRISELQKKSKENLVTEIMKKFTHTIIFNIDKLIGDPYGNYIIQFCYDYFGEDKCEAISQRIMSKILPFSLQKYSSAVVYKCVNSYWMNKTTLDRLKNTLNNQIIHQMFRNNKESNKILLQIVERNQGSALREKILDTVNTELTKFNHERWKPALGPRSGLVGTKFTSFPDPVKKPSKKKKNYNNVH